jgi:nucleoside-diphosphate-sugar epimerase
MGSAFVLGGTGQIGIPATRRLAEDGWEVTVAARHERVAPEFRFVRVDRTVPGELERAADGADVLVDVVPFTVADGEQLLSLAGRIGSVIAISSAAVYGFEGMPVPIPESQPTVKPGDEGYAARKRAIELLLEADELRATSIRAGAIHGPNTRHSREWYFVQRILDGREAIVLARNGAGRFHSTSVDNLAELIRLAAARPGTRILNAGDPDPPTALEISRVIAGALDHSWDEVLLQGPEQGTVGDHPWNVASPFLLDLSAAERELGYEPVTTYERAVPATVEWLLAAVGDRPWREVLTGSPYLETMFDYDAEDAFLAVLQSIQRDR